MSDSFKSTLAFTIMALLLFAVGIFQSWSPSLTILNLCLISAIMSLGVNIQWGYAGLINIGINRNLYLLIIWIYKKESKSKNKYFHGSQK